MKPAQGSLFGTPAPYPCPDCLGHGWMTRRIKGLWQRLICARCNGAGRLGTRP